MFFWGEEFFSFKTPHIYSAAQTFCQLKTQMSVCTNNGYFHMQWLAGFILLLFPPPWHSIMAKSDTESDHSVMECQGAQLQV